MRIIGITGMIGSGKGTIVDYMMKHHGYTHFSVRAYITKEILKRGLPVNRDTMREVGNDLRKHDGAFIIKELIKEAKESGAELAIIESLRTPDEIDHLEKEEGILFGVNAFREHRYSRIVERASETDKITYEKFLEDEARELTNTDPAKQNLKACFERATFKFDNSGTFEDLYDQIEEAVKKLPVTA